LARLFLIPFVIVSLVVLVWFLMHWLAQMGNTPLDMVSRLESLDGERKHDFAWQVANDLAVVLSGESNHADRSNRELAQRLAAILERECRRTDTTAERLELRLYLCTALGHFTVPDGLPALVLASAPQQPATIRQAAIESMARLGGVKHLVLRDDTSVMSALHDAAQTYQEDPNDPSASGDVRSRAAFALGVIGGPAAIQDLVTLLSDPFDDARRNAAAGLARQRDPRAIPELLRMLELRPPSPDRPPPQIEEQSIARKSEDWSRHVVWGTTLYALEELLANTDLRENDLSQLRTAVDRLAVDSNGAIHLRAKGLAQKLSSRLPGN